LGSPVAVAPILDHAGSVVMVLQNNDFVRINQFSKTERIRLARHPALIVTLADNNNHSYILFYPSGEMEKVIFNDNSPSGNKLSRANLRSLPAAPVAAASRDNKFAVTLRNGRTLYLDADGNTLWTRNSHETTEEKGSGNLTTAQVSMLYDERGVYVISTRGITGYSAEGRRRFIFRLDIECSGVPAFSDEGLLYATGKDNKLRIYKVDAKPRTIPRSRYYGPEPEGTYGMGNPPPSQWSKHPDRFSEANKLAMMEIIEEAIHSGQIGENEPEYVAYMMEMIGFFLNDPNFSPARPSVRPPERIRLIGLLGMIGSRETVPFLWNIFDRDREPSIKSACANAIGTIGVDPTGRSFVSYDFRVSANNPNIDPYLVLAATSSIAKLCRFAGPPLAPDGIRVLRWFSNLPSISNQLKAQIRDELDALYREGLDILIQ
jgi:outer membrane protein assembly factor BamB